MDNFAISCAIKTPVLLGLDSALTLDSILAALIFRESQDPEKSLRDIPLENVDGIWHGSAAFFTSLADASYIELSRRLTVQEMTDDRFAYPAHRGKETPVVDQGRGPYKAVINGYRSIFAERIMWFGRGDLQEVSRLLKNLHTVGKRGNSGYGWVEPPRIQKVDADYSLCMPEPDHPERVRAMRPIPIHLWNGGEVERRMTRFQPPYHSGEKHLCAIPVSQEQFWGRR